MFNLLKPIIERRLGWDDIPEVRWRKQKARDVCAYLSASPTGELPDDEALWGHNNNLDVLYCNGDRARVGFYEAAEQLLLRPDSQRLLLYLPFSVLKGAPDSFREVYLETWYDLLYVYDVRENFHFGDCFELEARPDDGLERVAKAAHLTPWLLKYGYLNGDQLYDLLDNDWNEPMLLESFRDTWNYIEQQELLKGKEITRLRKLTALLPARVPVEPLYTSEKRKKWLQRRQQPVMPALMPMANLAGPFSNHILAFEDKLQEIADELQPDEIVLVGGSQLKGYAGIDSDLDIWELEKLRLDEALYPGSIDGVHVYYNTLWLGGTKAELNRVSRDILEAYDCGPANPENHCSRRQAIERLESDLLLYRLLHSGFERFDDILPFRDSVAEGHPAVPSEMDGDCPFYDDRYRRIASMLYAKYVWL